MRYEIASSVVRLTILLFLLFDTVFAYSFLEKNDNHIVINRQRNHVDDKQFLAAEPELKTIVAKKYLNKEDDVNMPFETNEVGPKANSEKVLYQKINDDTGPEWTIVPREKRQRVTRQINQGYQHNPLYPQLPTSQPYGQYPPYGTQPNQNYFGQNPQTHGSNPSFIPTYSRQPQSGQYPPFNGSQYPSYNPSGQRPPYGGSQTPGYGTQYPSSHSGPHHNQYPSYTTSSTSYPIYNPASQTPPYNQPHSFNPTQRPGSSIPTTHYSTPNVSHSFHPAYNPTSQRPYSPPSGQYPTYNPSQQNPGSWQSSYPSNPPYNAHTNPPYNPSYPSYNPSGQQQPHLSYPGHAVGTLPNNYTNPYRKY